MQWPVIPIWQDLSLTPDDAYQNQKEGLRSIYIGIENGYVLGNDISLVSDYYNRGARYIALFAIQKIMISAILLLMRKARSTTG